VEVLENTLEVSREHIAKTEEKCDNLQKQGKRNVYFYFLLLIVVMCVCVCRLMSSSWNLVPYISLFLFPFNWPKLKR
jgi:uncharacterized membrane protein YjjP (DUF1212 family)